MFVEIKLIRLLTIVQKDIKEVLNDCIDYVITLKDHITRMLIFFRTFKTRVDTVMMSQITPFTGRAQNIINNHNLMFDLIVSSYFLLVQKFSTQTMLTLLSFCKQMQFKYGPVSSNSKILPKCTRTFTPLI